MRSNKKIEKIFDLKILYIDKYLTKKEKEKKKSRKTFIHDSSTAVDQPHPDLV